MKTETLIQYERYVFQLRSLRQVVGWFCGRVESEGRWYLSVLIVTPCGKFATPLFEQNIVAIARYTEEAQRWRTVNN